MQQFSLPRLAFPPQLQPAVNFKSIRSDEYDALNTYPSTQQSAREDQPAKMPSSKLAQPLKSHITLVESPKNHPPTF
jgi:hypothetical protein